MTNDKRVLSMDEIAAEDDASFGTAIQLFTDAARMMEEAAEMVERDLPEAMPEMRLAPDVMGQLLMNVLGTPGTRLTLSEKKYWLEVASHMGPDWINSMKQVSAFMDKFDKF
jgi:hypothetical protein